MRKIARILLTGVLLLSFIVLPLAACSGGKDRETINALLEEKEKVFQGEDEVAFANYIKLVRSAIANNNSLSFNDFLPYDITKDFIETNCTLISCVDGEGGFYDDHPYGTGDSYWYDPLEKESYYIGAVGRYYSMEEVLYSGDLMVIVKGKKWYGTDDDDPNNELKASLYYQDCFVSNEYLDIQDFFENVKLGNTYCADNGDEKCSLFILLDDKIIALQDELFAIKNE